jgi:hypothetical protein
MFVICRIQEVQRPDLRKLYEIAFLKFGNAEDQIIDGREGAFLSRTHDRTAGRFSQPSDVAQTDAQGEGSLSR